MKKQRLIITVLAVLICAPSAYFLSKKMFGKQASSDEALLAHIKNDQAAFERYMENGGDIHANLPEIDGKTFTVSEGLSHFERVSFVKYLQDNQIPFIQQQGKEFDILSLAIPKNHPEMMERFLKEKPNLSLNYGSKKWSLLHLASAECSHKIIPMLVKEGKMKWDSRSPDGSTPLTLAAEHDCLSALGFWKDQKADFNKKDGRGLSAMMILKKKKDAAIMAFVQSFEPSRRVASIKPEEVNFYRKRVIPKDQIVDHSALIEPEDRPLDSVETADHSEFSD